MTPRQVGLLLGLLLVLGCPPAEDDDTTGDDDDISGDDDDASGDDDDTSSDDDSTADDDTGDDDSTGDDDTSGDDDDATGDDDTTADPDADGDGWTVADGDCDDANPAVHPGATEICNGIDDDCSGFLPPWDIDGDGDGWLACDQDCDDADPFVNPDAVEICNGIDDDCDGSIPPWDTNVDADGDGWDGCSEDCDDADPLVNPWAAEICNGVDDDCDGLVDDGCHSCTTAVPGDFAQIQAAISAAADGDVICVDPGTYPENLDYLGLDLVVLGLAGPHLTAVDGSGFGSVVRLATAEGSSALLQGFTLVNGYAYHTGGGILVSGADPVFRRLIVEGNEATASGGGIYVDGGAAPAFDQVVVRDNHIDAFSGLGGGIHVADSSPAFTHVIVQGNSVGGGDYGDGGGVAMEASTSTWSHARILNNSCSNSCEGGGLYLSGCATSLENVRIEGNEVDFAGGGLYVGGGTLTGQNVRISENDAALHGAGIYAESAGIDLENFKLTGNASLWGDGLALFDSQSSVSLQNGVVSGNKAGLYDDGSGVWFLDGVVISGNAGPGLGITTGTATLSYCDLWDNSPDVLGMPNPVGADGNVSVEPAFLDVAGVATLAWDLHLDAASPLVDAGNPAVLDPDGSVLDMGAYTGISAASWDMDDDGYPEWWLPGPYDPATSPGMDCDDREAGRYPGNGC